MRRIALICFVVLLLAGMGCGQLLNNPFIVGSGIKKTTQGSSETGAPLWQESYFGFNGLRSATGWTFSSDGQHNGGAILTTDIYGQTRFLSVPSSSSGGTDQSITDSQIEQYTRMLVGPGVQIFNSSTTGLYVQTTHGFPYGYGVLSYVSQPYTKGLAVQLDLGKDGFVENFKVYGNGQVYAREVNVMSGNFPDYVFQPGYSLTPLDKLDSYIQQNKHLPNLPSAAEVSAQGLNLGQTQSKLVEKIEELTLYILEQQERIEALERRLGASSPEREEQQ